MEVGAPLLAQAVAGEPGSREAVLRAVSGDYRRLIYRLGAHGSGEDDLQELFVHLLSVLPRFKADGAASFTTWAHTVAHRWLLMERRRRHLTSVPLSHADDVADGRLDAHRALEGKQAGQALEAAVAKLPDAQRRAFVLFELHHQPLEQVALAEQVPLGTVKSRLHRARAELVLQLGELLDLEEGDRRAATR